jgi:hypothetical protein
MEVKSREGREAREVGREVGRGTKGAHTGQPRMSCGELGWLDSLRAVSQVM